MAQQRRSRAKHRSATVPGAHRAGPWPDPDEACAWPGPPDFARPPLCDCRDGRASAQGSVQGVQGRGGAPPPASLTPPSWTGGSIPPPANPGSAPIPALRLAETIRAPACRDGPHPSQEACMPPVAVVASPARLDDSRDRSEFSFSPSPARLCHPEPVCHVSGGFAQGEGWGWTGPPRQRKQFCSCACPHQGTREVKVFHVFWPIFPEKKCPRT